jgi:hypothetical protein
MQVEVKSADVEKTTNNIERMPIRYADKEFINLSGIVYVKSDKK